MTRDEVFYNIKIFEKLIKENETKNLDPQLMTIEYTKVLKELLTTP